MAKATKAEELKNAAQARDLLKTLPKQNISSRDIKTGTMIIFRYNAINKTVIYDKTPCNIVLWRTKTHTLCLAFHWAPLGLREKIVEYIYSINKDNIKNNKPLEVDYKSMKPFLRASGSIPIIRLYINSRMSKSAVIVPSESLKIAARYSNEDFSVPSAKKLYAKAVKDKYGK